MFQKSRLLPLGLVAAALAPLSAFAVDTVPDASAQITAITTGQAGYTTVMFALALTSVGIMVGIKWIKRGKGAA